MAPTTDDEGIERIDLTHEYVRTVETCDLAYADRMEIVRNSLEYSFLPGARLWASPDFARVASACQNDSIVTEKPSEPRRAFILLGLIEEGEKGGRVSSVLVGISASAELGRLEGKARLRRHRQRVPRFAEARAQEWQIHSALAD